MINQSKGKLQQLRKKMVSFKCFSKANHSKIGDNSAIFQQSIYISKPPDRLSSDKAKMLLIGSNYTAYFILVSP